MTAKYIKTEISATGAVQKLYKLDEELEGNEYVIVSAIVAGVFGPETFIFPSDKTGYITGFNELKGSLKGTLDHKEALNRAGYNL